MGDRYIVYGVLVYGGMVWVFGMHILPFVIYRLWRLIGFHATDVDYHLNTVGIKLFYM